MNIVVMALGYLGDTILVEPLCRNIKTAFPESRLVFIVNKVFEDVVKGFECVDEIIPFDKKVKHKGFWGYLRFVKEFPYLRKTDYCIITHEHERSLITALLIGAKKIISKPVKRCPLNIFISLKRTIINDEINNTYKADYFSDFLLPIAKVEHFPVAYKRDDINDDLVLNKFSLPPEYIVLSPTSKNLVKDWDFENVKAFISDCSYPVVLVGVDKAFDLGVKLSNAGIKYINLTKQTSIAELGVIIKHAKACVSVDTGTFHFSYSQGVQTIGIFFDKLYVKKWAPRNLKFVKLLIGSKTMDRGIINCNKDITAQEVMSELKKVFSQQPLN